MLAELPGLHSDAAQRERAFSIIRHIRITGHVSCYHAEDSTFFKLDGKSRGERRYLGKDADKDLR